jgi:DNA-binding CsgD family transcriptional regulator/pimeloyl-ACP methyl ester carboxylesterase
MDAPPVQYVKTSDGYDIAYFVAGHGPTLVRTPVLWTHTSRQWSADVHGPAFDALAQRFRLVLYDARGQGLPTRGLSDSHSFEDNLLDLEAVLGAVHAKRFTLSGWSYAGSVAIRYAVDHPECVDALILHEYTDFFSRPDAMLRLASDDWDYFIEATAHTAWAGFDPDKIKPILYDAMSQKDHLRQAEAIRSVSGERLLARLNVPALFIAHRVHSRPAAAEESAKRWAARLPHARLVLLDDPHIFGRDRDGIPEAVHAVIDFVDSLGQTATASEAGVDNVALLSARELNVLRLLAAGQSNPQIAEELGISRNTVAKHVTSIFAKSGAANRVEAATYAQRHGLA